MPKYNKMLTPYSQKLRKDMTDMERKLWYEFLCGLSVRFRRQKPIGAYIVDFYCAEAKLVIELDGSQHYERDAEKVDALRDEYLSDLGLTVLRYNDNEVAKNFSGVCEDIMTHLSGRCGEPRPKKRSVKQLRAPLSARVRSPLSPEGESEQRA